MKTKISALLLAIISSIFLCQSALAQSSFDDRYESAPVDYTLYENLAKELNNACPMIEENTFKFHPDHGPESNNPDFVFTARKMELSKVFFDEEEESIRLYFKFDSPMWTYDFIDEYEDEIEDYMTYFMADALGEAVYQFERDEIDLIVHAKSFDDKTTRLYIDCEDLVEAYEELNSISED